MAAPPKHDSSGRRVVFPARRPALLVYPLALITELAGVVFWLAGDHSLAIAACAAPIVALISTGFGIKPSLELTREDVIAGVGLTRVANRTVLAYRLRPGIPGPRRQPAAAILRRTGQPYDGGFFADSLRGSPEEILETVSAYLQDAELRTQLEPARR